MDARRNAGFAAFVAARSDDLLRSAVLLTSDREQAELLLQTALVEAHRRWRSIERADPYPAVRRVLVACAAGRRRLRSTQERLRSARVIGSFAADDAAAPEVGGESADRERMTAALATLPPRTRTVLVLRYAEDLDEAVTADTLGCSVATVRSETVRGLARLRLVFGDAPLRSGGEGR